MSRVFAAFRAAGFEVPAQAEALFPIDTWTRVSAGGRDVDLALGASDFDRQALARAVRVRLCEREIPIATAEDLILYKLVAHRRKDLAHVEGILERQGSHLDLPYLRASARGLAEATGRFEVSGVLERMLGEQGL